MVAERVQVGTSDGVTEAKAELLQTFGSMGGIAARAADFARVLPHFGDDVVHQALVLLADEGNVEVALLSDGAAVYHFIRP